MNPSKVPSSHKRPDLLVAIALAFVVAVLSYHTGSYVRPLYEDGVRHGILNAWFNSDPSRVIVTMTERESSQTKLDRSSPRHPLFASLSWLAVKALVGGLGLAPMEAVRILTVLSSGLWIVCFFGLLRRSGLLLLDAAIFCLVAMASGALIFFSSFPETLVLSSITLIAGLFLALALSDRQSLPAYTALSAMTLAITVSNWMLGVIVAFRQLRLPRAFLVTVLALAAVVSLTALQGVFFPATEGLVSLLSSDANPLLHQRSDVLSGGSLEKLYGFAISAMIVPQIALVEGSGWGESILLSFQHTQVNTVSSVIALACWLALVAFGMAGLIASRRHPTFKSILGLTILGQAALCLMLDEETFLYSMNSLPLLLLLAAFGAQTRLRLFVLSLAGTLAVLAGINNWQKFAEAARALERIVRHEKVNCLGSDQVMASSRCFSCLTTWGAHLRSGRQCMNDYFLPPPVDSDLVSDFEAGIVARFGSWSPSSNDLRGGGGSIARLRLGTDGVPPSRRSLLVSGEVRKGAGRPWAGVVFFPSRPYVPANLSARTGISFWTRGEKRVYQIELISYLEDSLLADRRDARIALAFETAPEWRKQAFSFADLGSSGDDISAIVIRTHKLGRFSFQIDDVTLR